MLEPAPIVDTIIRDAFRSIAGKLATSTEMDRTMAAMLARLKAHGFVIVVDEAQALERGREIKLT